MATIDNKDFINNIIANNGWHSSTFQNEEDKLAPDNARVAKIVEYTNSFGVVTWAITFVGDLQIDRYLLESYYVRSPKLIWSAEEADRELKLDKDSSFISNPPED